MFLSFHGPHELDKTLFTFAFRVLKICEDVHFNFDLCRNWETDLCVSKFEDFFKEYIISITLALFT